MDTESHLQRCIKDNYADDSLDALVEAVRSIGICGSSTPRVRTAAQRAQAAAVSSEIGSDRKACIDWLLARLANAPPPTYARYTGEPVLATQLRDDDPLITLTKVAHWAAEGFEALMSENILLLFDPEHRAKLEAEAGRIVAQYRRIAFATNHAVDLCGLPGLARWLLIPESGVPWELPFLRMVQVTDATFMAIGDLLRAARQSMAASDPAMAVLYLDRAVLGTKLLQPLNAALRLIPRTSWEQFRPAIVDPSAMHGFSFPGVVVELGLHAQSSSLEGLLHDAGRLAGHPRIPAELAIHEPAYRHLIEAIRSAIVDRWHAGHAGITDRFNKMSGEESTEGAQWLRAQNKVLVPRMPAQAVAKEDATDSRLQRAIHTFSRRLTTRSVRRRVPR